MQKLFLVTVIVLFSCQGPSNNGQAADSADSVITVASDDKAISCDQLIEGFVRSSNAVAFNHFNDTLVKAKIDDITPEKAIIKLYVISDISETSSEKRLVENAVGWLEFHRLNHRLIDITNDPDNPLILTYDTTLIQQYDLFSLCSAEAAIAKPETGNERGDVMLQDDIRFNGKLKRFFTLSDFEKVFGKPDSIKLLKDEGPCITIFDTEAPDDKYLFKSGSRFETSKDRVAVDDFWFLDGNYITYKGIRIDSNTTIAEITRLFPTAVKKKLGSNKEGIGWIIKLKEDKEDISDGRISIFFKNDKIRSIEWWLPC